MDKYQKFILSNAGYCLYSDSSLLVDYRLDSKSSSYTNLSETGILDVKQVEDYNVKKHYLRFCPLIVTAAVYKGKKFLPQAVTNSSYQSVVVEVDFDDPIEEMELFFQEDIKPIKIKLNFIPADKKAFDDKVQKEKEADLCSKANITISTGAELVNICFQPCSGEYKRTEITLYNANGMMMAKYKVDEEAFFKSITGLAFGNYSFVLTQFDNNNKVLFSSEKMAFSIKAPNYGGKPTVII